MQTPTNLSLWLRDQAWPILILLAFCALSYYLLLHSATRRRAALARAREGVTEDTFADYLAQFGFDRVIAKSLYVYLQQVQHVSFPILPSDKLDEDLGLDHDDVDQTVAAMAAALKRQHHRGLIQTPLVTVEDVVRLLQASPRISLQEDNRRSA